MDLNEIKEIIKAEGGKFIIVENGKPVMTITSYEDFKKRIKGLKVKNPIRLALAKPQKPLPKELEEEELKIEDLPF